MSHAQDTAQAKSPSSPLESGINLKAAYQALVAAYERTHLTNMLGGLSVEAPEHKGEHHD